MLSISKAPISIQPDFEQFILRIVLLAFDDHRSIPSAEQSFVISYLYFNKVFLFESSLSVIFRHQILHFQLFLFMSVVHQCVQSLLYKFDVAHLIKKVNVLLFLNPGFRVQFERGQSQGLQLCTVLQLKNVLERPQLHVLGFVSSQSIECLLLKELKAFGVAD